MKELFKKVVLDSLGPIRPTLCKFAVELVDEVPEYFWTVAASSSGKHHPEYALGEGGLARHSLMAYRWLRVLMEVNPQIPTDWVPGMILAALFHDCCKRGIPAAGTDLTHTKHEHPLLAAKFILDRVEGFLKDNKEFIESTSDDEELFRQDIAVAVSSIESHMGRWNTNEHSDVILPLPKRDYQQLVHLADYMASRKFTTFDSDFFVT